MTVYVDAAIWKWQGLRAARSAARADGTTRSAPGRGYVSEPGR
jgi:hypothetical protein